MTWHHLPPLKPCQVFKEASPEVLRYRLGIWEGPVEVRKKQRCLLKLKLKFLGFTMVYLVTVNN